jgi:hypothetical protein
LARGPTQNFQNVETTRERLVINLVRKLCSMSKAINAMENNNGGMEFRDEAPVFNRVGRVAFTNG